MVSEARRERKREREVTRGVLLPRDSHDIFQIDSYKQLQKCWDTPTKKRPFLLQIAPGHRSVRYNTDLPPIQSCSSKFWVWSCIANNFDKGRRGGHKHKIMDRPFMPKYGTVSQVLLQLVVAHLQVFYVAGKHSPLEAFEGNVYSPGGWWEAAVLTGYTSWHRIGATIICPKNSTSIFEYLVNGLLTVSNLPSSQ